MSIQSEITRIESEVATQADLISQIKTALESGGSGGGNGNVEIVTGTFTTSGLVDVRTTPIVVSDLSSKPKLVFVYKQNNIGNMLEQNAAYLLAIDSLDGIAQCGYRSSGDQYTATTLRAQTIYFYLNLTDNGFTITGNTARGDAMYVTGPYNYIAII